MQIIQASNKTKACVQIIIAEQMATALIAGNANLQDNLGVTDTLLAAGFTHRTIDPLQARATALARAATVAGS